MLEKSIYEQLNEIDDTLCLENWKKDEEVLEEASTINNVARDHSPLDQAEEYIPSDIEIDSLKGKSIKEIVDALNELKHKKFKEFHPEVPSNREKLRGIGIDV